jgi:hypothetical protein
MMSSQLPTGSVACDASTFFSSLVRQREPVAVVTAAHCRCGPANHAIDGPVLTVLLYVPGSRYDTVRATINSLRAQTARACLEVLLLAPDAGVVQLDDEVVREFCRVRVIHVGEVGSRAQAMAEGVRQASAALVAFAGNHSYPELDWARRLIDAHAGSWAAVAPSELNANPATTISWAHFLIGHGRWIFPVDGGETDAVPMTNGAFKRALLLECGEQLEQALERDGGLAQHLRRRGHRLLLESDARVHHFNISRLSSFVRFRVWVGRAYAASRARRERWNAARRLVYAIGWPLIPVIQLRPMIRSTRRCLTEYGLLPRVVPALLLGLTAHAVGEAIGYLFGMGPARREILGFESNLGAHMSADDRAIRDAWLEPGGQSA